MIGDVLHHRQPYRRALRPGLSTSHGALFRVASEWKTNVGLACRRRDTHVGAFDSVSCSASAIPSVSAAPRFADVCLDVTAETSQTIQGLRVPVRTCRRVASVLSRTIGYYEYDSQAAVFGAMEWPGLARGPVQTSMRRQRLSAPGARLRVWQTTCRVAFGRECDTRLRQAT